jgi:formylglycine-generating enzyme required for sulfatase activity
LTVPQWSGREVRALRAARRMSLREFADHLGVSKRVVTKWEAGGPSAHPGRANQEALDASLALAPTEVRARFAATLDAAPGAALDAAPEAAPPGRVRSGRHLLTHPVDGKAMVLVDAGSFLSGPDGRAVWLPPYLIDVYPTTNADYRGFVASTGHRPPPHWPAGVCPTRLLDHPVVNVTWHDAVAYARWADKALPEELEWEKAARGPWGALYPWGGRAVSVGTAGNVRDSGVGTTTPVGRFPDGVSPYGALDMVGNVWEWCATRTAAGRRRVMGGAYTSTLFDAMPGAGRDARAGAFAQDMGFRCVAAARATLDLLSI